MFNGVALVSKSWEGMKRKGVRKEEGARGGEEKVSKGREVKRGEKTRNEVTVASADAAEMRKTKP